MCSTLRDFIEKEREEAKLEGEKKGRSDALNLFEKKLLDFGFDKDLVLKIKNSTEQGLSMNDN